ncbi:MAG: DNA topoisomerase, partial [Gaiellaceae bacterium]
AEPRAFRNKVKNAQEAHEAIRPAGDRFRTPDQVRRELSGDELHLYDLIWKRTVASQMADARGQTVSVRIAADASDGRRAELATAGTVITFRGVLLAYEEGRDEAAADDAEEKRLPALAEGDALTATVLEPEGHSTSPPARYTEPSLVKVMEELGVGRPSTYASIMQTIQDRGYVWKKGAALVPSWTAFAVIGLLESYFGRLVDYGFTASVENDLDSIASGTTSRVEWLHRFYFGANGATPSDSQRISAQGGLKRLIAERLEEIDARGVNSIPLFDETVVRVGRYGPYLQRGGPEGDRASIPDDLAPDELRPEKVEELLSAPSGDRPLGAGEDEREITAKSGRYGPYVTDGE